MKKKIQFFFFENYELIKQKLIETNEVSQRYQKFKNVLMKLKNEILLFKYTKNDHEIIITNSTKIKTKSIYELNDKCKFSN